MNQLVSRSIRNSAVFLVALVPFISGCATIGGSIVDSLLLSDSDRKEKEERKDREWRERVDKQMKANTKGYRGILE